MNATTEWVVPDTWLVIFESDGSRARVLPSCESEIDAAVSQHIETGKDTLLHLTFIEGNEYTVRASRITSWFPSNPEDRARTRLVDELCKQETGWSEPG